MARKRYELWAGCGCGEAVLVKPHRELDCPVCGWAIVYATADGFALSSKAAFMWKAVPTGCVEPKS